MGHTEPPLGRGAESGLPPLRERDLIAAWTATDLEDDRLREGWDALAERAGATPMEEHAWVRCCAAALGDACEPDVTVLGPPDRPRAVAAFGRRRGAIGRLELLGCWELLEPTDLLHADESALSELASALAARSAPLFIKRTWADSPSIAALRRAYGRRGLVVTRPACGCPFIELDEGWQEPESRLGKRRRADLRRARRRAEVAGGLSAEVLSPGPAEVDALLERAFDVEAAGWKGRGGTALINDSRRARFFRAYSAEAARRGTLRVAFLRVGGHPAAMQLAVERGRRFWLLKMGYDESFARCSPGVLLLAHTIGWAAERGLERYELLGTVEPWTKVWTELSRPCVSVGVYPGGVRGSVGLAADAATLAWRRSAEAVLPGR